MRAACYSLLFATFGFMGVAAAQEKLPRPSNKAAKEIAQIQNLLTKQLVDAKDFPEELALSQFLAALEGQLPKENKFSIRLDANAFGKRLPQIAATPIAFTGTWKWNLDIALRKAMSRVAGEELDYAIRPEGIVITYAPLAAHVMVYDVKDQVKQAPRLLAQLKKWANGSTFQDLKPTDGPAVLVRALYNEVDLQSWETVEVRNGSSLVVLASPTRHRQIAELLDHLQQIIDVAVVMNARLYEVDRAFYTKQVAPLLAAEDTEESLVVVRIEEPLLQTLLQQKLLLESDKIKFRPEQEATFLSQQTAFRYAAAPDPTMKGRVITGTGLVGVSFKVVPIVSLDRRHLRLRITQETAQLVRIDKIKKRDVFSNKETELEVPNVHKTSVTGTVQTADTSPILMPVDYRPPGNAGEDKVWLMVARPFIWVEAEEQERRKDKPNAPFQSHVWKLKVPKAEEAVPSTATPLPADDETKELLQAILTDVLTNPQLKWTRDLYGTPKDKTVTLIDGDKVGWPKKFQPDTNGFKQVTVHLDPFVDQRRVLGIRLDKFDPKNEKAESPIEVCLFNAGGQANGAVIGGCSVYYVPKRDGKRWTVEFTGLLDP